MHSIDTQAMDYSGDNDYSNLNQDANFFIDAVQNNDSNNAWFASVLLGLNDNVKMKLDTGADTNCIPLKVFRTLTDHNRIPVKQSNARLTGYGQYAIAHIGKVNLSCTTHKGTSGCYDFYVTSEDGPPILGRQACSDLGLVKLVHTVTQQPILTIDALLAQYEDVFSGLGQFQEAYDIKLKLDVTPVIHPPRRVPLSILERLKVKLTDMENAGVIRKTTKPTDWVNSLVIVEKRDKSLRLCLDPKDLNLAIKREHFMIPTSADVISQMAGNKLFTVLDQKDSYWQVKLSEASSDLCTFNTPFGRYSFQRMPFGISSAREVLQRLNHQVFGDIQNVHIIADDMIIATQRSMMQHSTKLCSGLENMGASSTNRKLN